MLHEKKKQQLLMILCVFVFIFYFYRVEEVPVRHLLAIWTDLGHFGGAEPEDEGPGLCYI